MYSNISVDISANLELNNSVLFYTAPYVGFYMMYSNNPIIRGSSTVNEDSAHSEGSLHNYVSFYVKSIEIKYDIIFKLQGIDYFNQVPGYVILIKMPYKNDLVVYNMTTGSNYGKFILYTHPECVLAYDILNLNAKSAQGSHFLRYNKPFIVRPDDYVGIFYFFPSDRKSPQGRSTYDIPATAKVVFKPL